MLTFKIVAAAAIVVVLVVGVMVLLLWVAVSPWGRCV